MVRDHTVGTAAGIVGVFIGLLAAVAGVFGSYPRVDVGLTAGGMGFILALVLVLAFREIFDD